MIRSMERYRKRKKRRLKKDNNDHQNDEVQSSKNHPLSLAELPQELVFSEILTRLPVNSLTRFKSVSKTWNSVLSSPYFIKSHIKCTNSNPFVPTKCVFIKPDYYFYILNYAAYDNYPDDNYREKGLTLIKSLHVYDKSSNTFLIGSCNGLICFGRGNEFNGFDYYFHVYNPILGKSLHVFDPLGNFQGKLIYGFGFISIKDDYVLFVGGLQRGSLKTFVYVYSLKSKSWKRIGAFDESELSILMGGKGVLVSETLHWNMTRIRTSNARFITGFDLVNETFKDVKMPKEFLGNADGLEFRLSEMGGNLCVWDEDIYGKVEIWMLMQYGVWDSWTKLLKIDTIQGLHNFYGCIENGKVLVQTNDGSLLLTDLDQDLSKSISLVKNLGDIEVVSYIRTLVSPFL